MKQSLLLKCLLLFFTVLFSFQKSNAHTITLQGTVKDSLTKESLPGVTVYITETKTGQQTNELGKFHFHDLEEGTYHIKVSSLGYKSQSLSIGLNEKTSTLTIFLSAAPITLKEITTNTNRPLSESM